jgi:hypothetical protein
MAGACLVLLGGDKGGALFSDVWVFNLELNAWSQPLGSNQNMPSARSGHARGSLPQAHTCFNQLVLPPYTSARALEDRLVISPLMVLEVEPSELVLVPLVLAQVR